MSSSIFHNFNCFPPLFLCLSTGEPNSLFFSVPLHHNLPYSENPYSSFCKREKKHVLFRRKLCICCCWASYDSPVCLFSITLNIIFSYPSYYSFQSHIVFCIFIFNFCICVSQYCWSFPCGWATCVTANKRERGYVTFFSFSPAVFRSTWFSSRFVRQFLVAQSLSSSFEHFSYTVQFGVLLFVYLVFPEFFCVFCGSFVCTLCPIQTAEEWILTWRQHFFTFSLDVIYHCSIQFRFAQHSIRQSPISPLSSSLSPQ